MFDCLNEIYENKFSNFCYQITFRFFPSPRSTAHKKPNRNNEFAISTVKTT